MCYFFLCNIIEVLQRYTYMLQILQIAVEVYIIYSSFENILIFTHQGDKRKLFIQIVMCKHSKLECSGDKGVSDIESLIYELYGKTTSYVLK